MNVLSWDKNYKYESNCGISIPYPHPRAHQKKSMANLHSLSSSLLGDVYVYVCICVGYKLDPVLVCLSCHNRILQTGRLKWQKLIFSQSGAWNSQIKVPAGLVSGEASLFGLQTAAFSLVSHGLSSAHVCTPGVSSSSYWIGAPSLWFHLILMTS